MSELEQMIRVLENAGIQSRTLEELINDGFSSEDIEEALQMGYLQKNEDNGVYEVVNLSRSRQQKKAIRMFRSAMFARKYSDAYQYMKTYLEITPSTECDMWCYFVMLLLKELLPSEYDFSLLENIHVFSSRKDPRYQRYSKFYDSILFGDYHGAMKSQIEIEEQSKQTNKKEGVLTQTFRILLDTVLFQGHRNLKNISSDEKDEKYQMYYKKFLDTCEKVQAREALEALKQMAFYDRKENRPVYSKVQDLLVDVLGFMEDEEMLLDVETHFTYFNEPPKIQLEKALINRDYKNAYIFVKKCLAINPDDPWLFVYDKWLRKLVQLDKKNTILKKNKKRKKVSSSDLADSIYHREYQQLLQSFRSGEILKDQSRMHGFIYQMLEYLNKFYENKAIIWEKHLYVNDSSKPLARFYEALSCQDYEEAFRLFPECMQLILDRGSDTQEISTYGYILEDIAFEKCKRRVSDLLNKSVFDKKLKFSISWLHVLRNLFEKKLDSFSVLQEAEYDSYVLNAIDMLLLIKENHLGMVLCQYEYEEDDALSMWKSAMDVGDYLSALSLMKKKTFFKQHIDQSLYAKYFSFLEQLLGDMKKTMIENEHFVPIEKPLQQLQQMIENNDFVRAYQYYKDMDMGDISLDLETTLCALIPVLNQFQKTEACALLTQYQVALTTGDMEKAEQSISKYQELIQNTVLDRNLDYYRATIQSERLERTSADYDEKNELYKQALKLFKERRNQEAILLLDQYIEKDSNMSAKGYFLRGRAKEYLKQYDEAVSDYLAALSIVPDPAIYYRLGQIYYYQKQYPLAFDNFLANDERDPLVSEGDLVKMMELSDALEKPEYKTMYEQKIKQLGALSNK